MPPTPPETASNLPDTCRDLAFEGVSYIVCEFGLDDHELVLKRADRAGKPFGDLAKLAAAEPFVFAMNAGMYHEDFTPVGLHVEDCREQSPINLADAEGNFFLKPNGVFYVDQQGNAGALESSAFAAAGIKPRLATQSGPMLVIDGKIHPRFEENGTSRHIRNGVAADGGKRVAFAISRGPVSLGSFARLFRDALGYKNALFFDGTVSALHDGSKYLIGGEYPAGPMLAVRKKTTAGVQ
ncbi:phosphodiester glycosidase family protein [Mesorhizobium sp. KR9-304]|uniref:phosphodiester glycosidase family protein n=1 Tax=Mesorhizobium sp. KR9-304 TaxID=3156614 RepID=UPI0032B4A202